MKRLLIACTVALTTATSPAHAAPARDYGGSCGFDTINDTTPDGTLGGPDRYNGVAYVAVYATASDGRPLPTATISIDCELYVNGVLTDVATSASGVGAAVGAGTFSFEAGPFDAVELCERAVVDGEEIFDCYFDDPPPVPPNWVVDFANENVFEPIVDPVVCPLFGALAPGVPGVLDITPEGDVTVLTGLLWDCPPYDET